jgi:hypothetical protein
VAGGQRKTLFVIDYQITPGQRRHGSFEIPKHLDCNSTFAGARPLPFGDSKFLGGRCRAISVAFTLAEQDGRLFSPNCLEDVQYSSPPVWAGRMIPIVGNLG